MKYDVIIIGGGASGFFTANILMDQAPDLNVLLLEKSNKLLQKVKISGGGRCNVTHHEFNPTHFSKSYPRGKNLLKKNLRAFGAQDMIEWLNAKGIQTKTEEDGRMFPVSNNSQSIIDCLLQVTRHKNFTLCKKSGLTNFEIHDDHIEVCTASQKFETAKLVLSVGSSQSIWKLLSSKGIKIVKPVPSLFTFTLEDHPLKGLEGISVPNAHIKVVGTKLQSSGPLLITHKGLSGPCVLRLSAYGARELAELKYRFRILINFSGFEAEEDVREKITELSLSKKQLIKTPQFGISKRLWERLLDRSSIDPYKPGRDLNKKEKNKLVAELYQGTYSVKGKNTFKEEFVTAGGIDLSEVERASYSLKKLRDVYATGEVLNIDGVTGGFNFQGCWTSGWMAANEILKGYS